MVREWYGYVRDITEEAEQGMRKFVPAESASMVKLKILFRHFLCISLSRRIEDAEQIKDKDLCQEIKGDVYSELIEDALAGFRSMEEEQEIALLLMECQNLEYSFQVFRPFFQRALTGAVEDSVLEEATETAAASLEKADERLFYIALEKKKKELDKLRWDSDDPPPWLDEFEYIDWLMTH